MAKGRQVILGKGFEYACAVSIMEAAVNPCVLVDSEPMDTAKKAYENELTAAERSNCMKAAQAGVRLLLRYEPQIANSCGNDPLYISLQSDKHGQVGDVRDVLCVRMQNQWEIGISCKHNHDAVKHSRLSQTIDFGKAWLNIPCSQTYFDEIRPIFDRLQTIKDDSKGRALWSDIGDEDVKANEVYKPILEAFKKELLRLNEAHPSDVPKALIQYLIGRKDFYKFIAQEGQKSTKVQAFNMDGTLNKRAGSARAVSRVQPLRLPRSIFAVRFALDAQGKEKLNTLEVVCDNGWSISMRIHSASSKVEASLKFDVRLEGHGTELENHTELW